jgi:hypothetical protein
MADTIVKPDASTLGQAPPTVAPFAPPATQVGPSPPVPTVTDDLPQLNTYGPLEGPPPVTGRGFVIEAWIYVGRILFDPNVFGDHGAYFADTVTTDDYERSLVQQGQDAIKKGADPTAVRNEVRQDIARHEQKKKDKNVEIQKLCKLGKYGDLKPTGKDPCPSGAQAHHVPPDMVFRYGTRTDNSSRMPDLGSQDDGLSICLSTDDHKTAHRLTDPAIRDLGGDAGYAPLGDVIDKSMDGLKDLNPDDPTWAACLAKLKQMLDDQYKDKKKWPVRTTRNPPGDPRDAGSGGDS